MNENKISIYIYEDSGEKFTNDLFGKRLTRYNQAIREPSQRKLVIGSHLTYTILNSCGLSSNLTSQSFEKSAHEIEGLPFYISLSNSDLFYVLAISDKSVGVDVEIDKDRNCSIYDRYLRKVSEELNLEEKKEQFYKKWLEKETKIKVSTSCIKNKMYYRKLSNILLGIYGIENANLSIFKMNSIKQKPIPIELESF